MSAQPRRLGRGLDALLGAYPVASPPPAGREPGPENGRRSVPIAVIQPNPRNPRRDFREEEMRELADSIREHGLVQAIVVRAVDGGGEKYEIIAGERRWRAAQMAGLHEVPVSVVEADDRRALELAIVENVQRTDLNPIEEARGYQALLSEFGYSQGALGETIGKSRVHVANALRLLKLPQPVLDLIEAGKLSAGHGRALLATIDAQMVAQKVIEKSLSVRATERLVQSMLAADPAKPRSTPPPNADLRALERELTNQLGNKVEVRHGWEGHGEVRISYRSLEQLEDICRKLKT